jgi:hypothetical protein
MSFSIGDYVRIKPTVSSNFAGRKGQIASLDSTSKQALVEIIDVHSYATIWFSTTELMLENSPVSTLKELQGEWLLEPAITDTVKTERKAAGQCEQCGTVRPMSIHGLLDCPNHPTIVTE